MGDGHVLTVTDFPAREPAGTVVLCHGLTGDRVGPQRLLTVLAEEIALGGFLCLRFDFRGSGDSSGDFSGSTFTSMREDVELVTSWGRERYGRHPLGLVGLSIGGVPLAVAARRFDHVGAVVLLSSDVIEDVYFPDIGPMVAIRGGEFQLPASFWRERELLHPFSDLLATGSPVKLFYGAQDEKLAREARRFRAAGFSVEQIRGVGHLFENIETRHYLGRRVVRFLRRHLVHPARRP